MSNLMKTTLIAVLIALLQLSIYDVYFKPMITTWGASADSLGSTEWRLRTESSLHMMFLAFMVGFQKNALTRRSATMDACRFPLSLIWRVGGAECNGR